MLFYYLTLLEISLLYIVVVIGLKKTGGIRAIMLNILVLSAFPVILIYTSVVESLAAVLIASTVLGFLFPKRVKGEKQVFLKKAKKKTDNPHAAKDIPHSAALRQTPQVLPNMPQTAVYPEINNENHMESFDSIFQASEPLKPAISPRPLHAKEPDRQAAAGYSPASPLAQGIIDEFYNSSIKAATEHNVLSAAPETGTTHPAPEREIEIYSALSPSEDASDIKPETNALFEMDTADLGGLDINLTSGAAYGSDEELFELKQPEAESKTEKGLLIEFPGYESDQPETYDNGPNPEFQVYAQEEANSAENQIFEPEKPESVKPLNNDIQARLKSYGINFDNDLTMSEFLTNRTNKPGSLCEIASIVRAASEEAGADIEILLRKLCLESADPFISNKALYAVQSIRASRGQGEDKRLISELIAKEEKMINEVSADRLAGNF